MGKRRVTLTFTASQADGLNSTPLQQIQPGSIVTVYTAASQNDWTVSITPPDEAAGTVTQKVQQRTNGMVILSDDPGWQVHMPNGGHLVVNVTVVTAGTGQMIVDEDT